MSIELGEQKETMTHYPKKSETVQEDPRRKLYKNGVSNEQ
jgi:hypothetical protein